MVNSLDFNCRSITKSEEPQGALQGRAHVGPAVGWPADTVAVPGMSVLPGAFPQEFAGIIVLVAIDLDTTRNLLGRFKANGMD